MKQRHLTHKAERGAALIEFALVFILMFGLVYAIMEFGRFVYSYTILAGATREGARYAVVHGNKSSSPATTDDVRAAVARWSIGLDASNLNVLTTWDPSNSPGSRVRVQASYSFTPMSRFIYSAPITIGSRSEMVISQ